MREYIQENKEHHLEKTIYQSLLLLEALRTTLDDNDPVCIDSF